MATEQTKKSAALERKLSEKTTECEEIMKQRDEALKVAEGVRNELAAKNREQREVNAWMVLFVESLTDLGLYMIRRRSARSKRKRSARSARRRRRRSARSARRRSARPCASLLSPRSARARP